MDAGRRWATISSFWLGYLTNGKHLAWYASVPVHLGRGGARLQSSRCSSASSARRSRTRASRPSGCIGIAYTNIVRGVPDVLFFLFFPLAFEQGVEWLIRAQQVCTPAELAAHAGRWPPCDGGQLATSTPSNT